MSISIKGKTIGKGGFGKCIVKFSEKYKKKIVEKKLNIIKSYRSTVMKLPFPKLLEYLEKKSQLAQEAEVMDKINVKKLKYCVEFYEYIKDPPTIIMEYCEGGDLRELLNIYGDNIPIIDRMEFIFQILKGLKNLHQVKIIHGDLKALNILLSKKYNLNEANKNEVKLADFGISAVGNDNVHGGTPGFMAPEVPKEGGSYKSDIYSVGKVMIEIMTCRSMEEVSKINYNSLIDSTSLFPEFDYKDKFISIVRECIQIDPNERPNINELYKKYKNQILLNYQSYKNIITQKKQNM